MLSTAVASSDDMGYALLLDKVNSFHHHVTLCMHNIWYDLVFICLHMSLCLSQVNAVSKWMNVSSQNNAAG